MSYFNTTTGQSQPIIAEAVKAVERQQYAGQYILPFSPKQSMTGKYPVIALNQFNNDMSKPRARGAKATRVDFEYSQATFSCQHYALESAITDDELDEAQDDGYDELVIDRANHVADAMLVGHDKRVASLLSSAGFNSTGATAAFSNASSAKPITDIENARQRLNDKGFFSGLHLIIESSLWTEMRQTADFRDLINGSGKNKLMMNEIAEMLEIDGIIICRSNENTAAKGKAGVLGKIWSTSQIYIAQIAGGGFGNGGIGRTIIDTRKAPAPFGVDTYRDETLEENIVRVKNRVSEVIINANAGELITGC